MNNDLFHELVCETLYRPDDGCDYTSTIIWEMRAGMRRRCGEETQRPVPNRVVAKKKGKSKAHKETQEENPFNLVTPAKR